METEYPKDTHWITWAVMQPSGEIIKSIPIRLFKNGEVIEEVLLEKQNEKETTSEQS